MVVQLELLDDIGDPALSEAFPGEGIERTRTEHRPHGHLEGTGVGGRHDADPIVIGNAENGPAILDHPQQFGLGIFRTMRTANTCGRKNVERPAGSLGTGSR